MAYLCWQTRLDKIIRFKMNKYISPLKLKDILTLLGLIALGFGWLLIDQFFLMDTNQRFIAFIILTFILFYLQFVLNKPINVITYCNSIALITLSFAVIVSLIMHVIINNDFSYKSILIWLISGLLPYITGLLYVVTKKNKARTHNIVCIIFESKWVIEHFNPNQKHL